MANRVRVTYILAVRETGARRRYDQDSFKNHPIREKNLPVFALLLRL